MLSLLYLSIPLALVVYRYIVYPIFLSPLSKIPAIHPTAAVSPVYILWIRRTGTENVTVHAAHRRLGPLVRLGPKEISVNCVNGGIRTVYGGGFEKGGWYSNAFNNYGVHNMFSTEKREIHSARKRMLSNVYAKSVLQASPALAQISEEVLCHRMLPRIAAVSDGVVEAYELFSAVTMDLVTAYQFGLKQGANHTQDAVVSAVWLRNYRARQHGSTFWPQELPTVTKVFSALNLKHLLIPKWVDQANADIETWCMSLCDAAESATQAGAGETPGDHPTVYCQLRTMMMKQQQQQQQQKHPQGNEVGRKISILTEHQRLEIASEMLDHLAAGFDTSGITLTYLAWELSRPHNICIQQALQKELRLLNPSMTTASGPEEKVPLPNPKDVDALPLLHAVVMETLRLHSAIPGGQPRMTPADATLGEGETAVHGIPAGIRVNASAYSLHRNADVFPEPETWRPQRWLDSNGCVDAGGEKARWFWAFGSGGRMCVGSNIAMAGMKNTVAAIWSNYTTTLVNDAGMVHEGGYMGGPIGSPEGNYLLLRFERLAQSDS